MNIYGTRDLGAAARQKRESLGLTQQAVADAAGVSREWLIGFEAGKPGVSLSRVFTVMNTLQLALDLSDAEVDEDTTLDDVFAALDRPWPAT